MLENGVTFIDVELANASRDSICALGIVHRDAVGREDLRRAYRIDPQVRFSKRNTAIHGISEADVIGKPAFPEVWAEIEPYLTGSLIVAHNAASMDLSALCASLDRYGLAQIKLYYACTLCMARRRVSRSETESYRLDDLAFSLHVSLPQHHDPLDDASACAEIYHCLIAREPLGEDEVSEYEWPGRSEPRSNGNLKRAVGALRRLQGLLLGIKADEVIHDRELSCLCEWNAQYEDLASLPTVGPCMEILGRVLESGFFSFADYRALLGLSAQGSADVRLSDCSQRLQVLLGILDGIQSDGRITAEELRGLEAWMRENRHLCGEPIFDRVFEAVSHVLEDGVVDEGEQWELRTLFKRLSDPVAAASLCEGIEFSGKRFCLSGNFSHGTKAEVEAFIVQRGGKVSSSVGKKLDYLVVGSIPNENWKFGTYGGKVQEAMALQKAGSSLRILTEEQLYTSLEPAAEPAVSEVFEQFLQEMKEASPEDAWQIGMNLLKDGKKASYTFYDQVTLYLVLLKDSMRFEVQDEDFLVTAQMVHPSAFSKNGTVIIPVDLAFRHDLFANLIRKICYEKRMSARVEEFGCCNSFIECSDARRCLHAYEEEYLGCMYRRNLEAGRIFYGKNKNI